MSQLPDALRLAKLMDAEQARTVYLDVMHCEAAAELRRLHEMNQELLEALQQAEDHLEYTGWGDSWERECAREAKLPELISAAIAKAKDQS